jgi:hypothetical protein
MDQTHTTHSTHTTTHGHQDRNVHHLLVASLIANLVFLGLALVDWYAWDRRYVWAVFIPWAAIILLTILVVLLSSSSRVHVVRDTSATPALARAVATLAARPAAPPPAPAPPAKAVVEFTEDPFPFTYNGYTLYSRSVDLKNGGTRPIWFFSKRTPASGSMARKPSGFHVGVNERTGLPFLKKGGGADGEDLTPDAKEAGYRPQCSALTEDGAQCRNSARADSKYCASHFGYQPKTLQGSAKKIEGESWSPRDKLTNKQSVARADTKAKVKGAPDTKPSVRKRSSV